MMNDKETAPEGEKKSWGYLIYWRLDFQKVSNRHFEKYYVKKDCQLREFVVNVLNKNYSRGCVFYEFYHEIESVSEEQELIFVETKVNFTCMCSTNDIE